MNEASKKETKGFTKLERAFKGYEVKMCGAYMIDGKMVVTETFLAEYFGTHKRSVNIWVRKGLTKHDLSLPSLNLYDLGETIEWRKKNISVKTNENDIIDESETPIDQISKREADRRGSIESYRKTMLTNKELDGSLVRAEDLDRSMAEQAVLHKTYYMDDLELLPVTLEGLNKDQISEFLNEHYSNRIENISSFIKKTFSEPNFFYNKIKELLNEP